MYSLWRKHFTSTCRCDKSVRPNQYRNAVLLKFNSSWGWCFSGGSCPSGPLHHRGHQGGLYGPGSGAAHGDDGDSPTHRPQAGKARREPGAGRVCGLLTREVCVFRLLLLGLRTSTWSWTLGRNFSTGSRNIFLYSSAGESPATLLNIFCTVADGKVLVIGPKPDF